VKENAAPTIYCPTVQGCREVEGDKKKRPTLGVGFFDRHRIIKLDETLARCSASKLLLLSFISLLLEVVERFVLSRSYSSIWPG